MTRGRPGRLQPLAYAVADHASFHLRKCRLYLQKGLTGRRRGVHGRIQRAETDAALVKPIDESDEFARKPPETVEMLEDENIARPPVFEAGAEVGPAECGVRSAVVENAFATSGVSTRRTGDEAPGALL